MLTGTSFRFSGMTIAPGVGDPDELAFLIATGAGEAAAAESAGVLIIWTPPAKSPENDERDDECAILA